ncbi:hypothetical protein K439DRAFT_1325145, partial [Ramaria rubella]
PPFIINDRTVYQVESHKFLGVILDQELRFKEHGNYALKKGTSWTLQFQQLKKVTKGILAKYMRKYYLAVAVPKILYATDVFLVPETSQLKGTKGLILKLAQIQRMAALHIMGAMQTSPTDSVEAHSNLIPFKLLVHKVVH